MARAKPSKRITKLNQDSEFVPKVYVEGTHDRDYLRDFLKYAEGTPLQATAVALRITEIRRDINNDAIDCVIWIVDGGDQHIKASKHFVSFYKEWLARKDDVWEKLYILINAPCLEYWFLLHRTDPPIDVKAGDPICFENANALDDSVDFKTHCKEGKGARLVRAIAADAVGRKQAIRRAKGLNNQLSKLADKKLLSVARAEMYQIFELIQARSSHYSALTGITD